MIQSMVLQRAEIPEFVNTICLTQLSFILKHYLLIAIKLYLRFKLFYYKSYFFE